MRYAVLAFVLSAGLVHAQTPAQPPSPESQAPDDAQAATEDGIINEEGVVVPFYNNSSQPTTVSSSAQTTAGAQPIYPTPAIMPATPPTAKSQRAMRGIPYNVSWRDRPIAELPSTEGGNGGTYFLPTRPLLPNLPGLESDLVVVGWVISGQSYLSPDAKGAYTEYSFKVQSVVSNKGSAVSANDTVTLTRTGGLLQFHDGRLQWEGVTAEVNIPKRNGRYLLFLQRDESLGVATILAGYRLLAGKVVEPLDHFDTFKGMREAALVDRTKAAIHGAAQ